MDDDTVALAPGSPTADRSVVTGPEALCEALHGMRHYVVRRHKLGAFSLHRDYDGQFLLAARAEGGGISSFVRIYSDQSALTGMTPGKDAKCCEPHPTPPACPAARPPCLRAEILAWTGQRLTTVPLLPSADLGKVESDGLYMRRGSKKAPKLCAMELRYGKKNLPDGTRQLTMLLPARAAAEPLMPFSPSAMCARTPWRRARSRHVTAALACLAGATRTARSRLAPSASIRATVVAGCSSRPFRRSSRQSRSARRAAIEREAAVAAARSMEAAVKRLSWRRFRRQFQACVHRSRISRCGKIRRCRQQTQGSAQRRQTPWPARRRAGGLEPAQELCRRARRTVC